MNRQVIFKGKRKDNGQWVEGSLNKTEEGNLYIFNYYFIPTISVPSEKFIEVDSETVSQFIRLDVQGEKVFEGDILDSEYIAKWSDEICGFYLESKFGSDHNKLMSYIDENNLKVGFSIHDKQ